MSDVNGLGQQHDYGSSDGQAIGPGAVVMAGRNLGPLYRIVAVDGDNAWIRELDRGVDAIAPIGRLLPA